MSVRQRPTTLKPVSRFSSERIMLFRLSQRQKKTQLDIGPYDASEEELSQQQDEHEEHTNESGAFVQDSRRSGATFRSLLFVEYSLLVLVLVSIMASVLEQEVNLEARPLMVLGLLAGQSIITLLLISLVVVRYKLLLRLKKDQKVQSLDQTILRGEYVGWLVTECLLMVVHPNLGTKGQHSVLYQPYDCTYLLHRTNSLLSLGMLVRTYAIVRAVIVATNYSSPRASRLCRLYGCQHCFMFSIKCIMKEKPLRALTFLFIFTVLVFGYGLKLSQQDLILEQPNSQFDLSDLENCFWCIIITMGTVGYGDYYPKTYPGRIITILAAITGVILSSLLIITLNAYLSMNSDENKAHITLERLKVRTILERLAQQTVKQTASVAFNLKVENPELRSSFQKLRKNAHNVKMMMRKLQTVVETDNVNEQMYRLFEILKVNMKEIYENQLQIKELLSALYRADKRRLRSMKFSFTAEIQSMIRDS